MTIIRRMITCHNGNNDDDDSMVQLCHHADKLSDNNNVQ